MTCTCNCSPNGNGFSTGVNCYCNEFARVGPFFNPFEYFPYNPFEKGLSYVKSQLLIYAAEDISVALRDLQGLLQNNPSALQVIDSQKPVLISTLKTYNTFTATIQSIFDRDDAVNTIFDAISTVLVSLSSDPNYQGYLTQLAVVRSKVDAYFQLAGSTT